jgi:hypothetical protein
MTKDVVCKFCKKPVTLTVSDDYAQLGDPFKIMAMAACNQCVDKREEHRALQERIKLACMNYYSSPFSKVLSDNTRAVLERHIRKYNGLVSKWISSDELDYDPAVVDALMENPTRWLDTLKRVWVVARQSKRLL